MPRPKQINTNPIIEQLKGEGGAVKLAGFIGRGANGTYELYSSLALQGCVEIAVEDILHVVDASDPTEPSMLFVRRGAKVTARVNADVEAIRDMGFGGDCACGTDEGGGDPAVAARRRPTSGSADAINCNSKRLGCYVSCQLKHDDPMMVAACKDSCDASYRLCRSFGSGGLVMF